MADPVEVESKKPWESKTLWANFIMAAVALIPSQDVQDFFLQNSGVLPMLFLMVNTLLRLVTKDKISLKD